LALLGWMLVGLVIGGLFHVLSPRRIAGGSAILLLLGIAGAMLAGFLGRALDVAPADGRLTYVVAAAGAVAFILLLRLALRRGQGL
jgi:uncharacterized membrane protein YeaQ/YmgE (transglycosylase-associated protein family)